MLGLGPIGLCAIQVARAYGALFTAGTDIYAAPLQMARSVGASLALDAKEREPAKAILEATGGMGVDVLVDTIGSPSSLRDGLAALARSGTLVNLAVHGGEYSFDGLSLGSERSIRTSSNSLFSDYGKAIRLAASGAVNLSVMITHRFPLDEVPRAFDLLMEKERHAAVKAVIIPGSAAPGSRPRRRPRPLTPGARRGKSKRRISAHHREEVPSPWLPLPFPTRRAASSISWPWGP